MHKENKTFWLSILIPSYEYSEGVLRILNFIEKSRESNIECIVSDDSRSKKVEIIVKGHQLYKKGKVVYSKNRSPLGAVKNWNSLMKKSSGEYSLFLHHDECPEDLDFFKRLKKSIKEFNEPDIIFLRCSHPSFMDNFFRYNMPYFITKLVLRYLPDMLLLHNLIGSPSNLAVKRNSNLFFDEKLRWLVDADWVVRLLKQKDIKWIFKKTLSIISVVHEETSITRSLGAEIKNINIEESKAIRDKLNTPRIFYLLVPDTWMKKFLKHVERFIWISLYFFIFIGSFFSMRFVPKWWRELEKE